MVIDGVVLSSIFVSLPLPCSSRLLVAPRVACIAGYIGTDRTRRHAVPQKHVSARSAGRRERSMSSPSPSPSRGEPVIKRRKDDLPTYIRLLGGEKEGRVDDVGWAAQPVPCVATSRSVDMQIRMRLRISSVLQLARSLGRCCHGIANHRL